MRPALFYPLVILLYLASLGFAYEYVSYTRIIEDETRIEVSVSSTNDTTSPGKATEVAVLEQEKQNLQYESYGYLAGACFFILCPTLLLVFRQRLIS